MAYNQMILEKLQNIEVAFKNFDRDGKKRVFKALSSVCRADSADANVFRRAFIDHKDTWKDLLDTAVSDVDKDFLIQDGEGDDKQKKTNSFNALQNAAAFAYYSLKLPDLMPDSLNKIAIAEKDILEFKNSLTDDNFTAIQEQAKQLLFEKLRKRIDELVVDAKVEVSDTYIDNYLKNSGFPNEWISEEYHNQIRELFKQKALNAYIKELSSSKDRNEILNVLEAKKPEDIVDKNWLTQDDITTLQEAARKAFIPMIQEEIRALSQDIQNPKAQLEALRKATLPPLEFKNVVKYLEQAGIKEFNLLKNQDMPALIRTIREKAFTLHLEQVSEYGASAHPQLMKAFKNLDPIKQQEIMQHLDNTVYRLMHSEQKEEIQSIFGNNEQINHIIQENKRIQMFHKIHNAEIAKILANYKPAIQGLNVDFVNFVNKEIRDHFLVPALIKNIVKKIFPAREEGKELFAQFGFENLNQPQEKVDNASKETIDRIQKQINYNEHLIERGVDINNSLSGRLKEKLILLRKHALLDQANIEAFLSAFKEHSTYKSFLTNIPAQVKQKITSPIEEYFTPEAFRQLKNIQIESIQDVEEKIKTATNQIEAMDKEFDALAMADKDTRIIFRKILRADFEPWFDPAFMAKAREDAKQLKAPFEALANNSSIIIRKLEEQQSVLNGLLNLFQKEDKFYKSLALRLDRVNGHLAYYKKVQDKILGQGDYKKGILQMIDEAIQGDVAIQGYHSNDEFRVVVNLIDKSDKSFKSGTANQNKDHAQLDFGSSTSLKFEKDKIPTGKIRAFNVTHQNHEGRFTEEFGHSNPNRVTVKDTTSTPSVSLKVQKFPTGNSEAAIKAKINFSMVMAGQMLSTLDGPPDHKHPVVLRGGTEEELRYLWTALMVMGRDTPHMKFGAEAIKVVSFSFDPKNEQGNIGRFAAFNASLYSKVFSNYESVYRPHVRKLGMINKIKLGHESGVKAATEDLTRLFRKEVQKGPLEQERDSVDRPPKGPGR